MKKRKNSIIKVFFVIMILFSSFLLVSCSKYDDSLIKERIDVVEEGYKKKLESLESRIKELEYKIGVLGGDINQVEEKYIELKREKEILETEINILYSKRQIEFEKTQIEYVNYYDKVLGQTKAYLIKDDVQVLRIYLDMFSFEICIDYSLGYTLRLGYIYCTITYKK